MDKYPILVNTGLGLQNLWKFPPNFVQVNGKGTEGISLEIYFC